jgi:hypothetical protein
MCLQFCTCRLEKADMVIITSDSVLLQNVTYQTYLETIHVGLLNLREDFPSLEPVCGIIIRLSGDCI